MALGIDPLRSNVMHRPPRPPGERILNIRRLMAITRAQWAVCLATASTVLLAEHAWRAARSRLGHAPDTGTAN
ncbi:hypothetical protein ACFV7R_29890 [Streptomyces sp. NPDC059866]|uniref:hypothetical protein n=1 Tax=Streptomyces sp. NPDC059866 TaxID=3346978 RepID=UPI00364DFB94